VRLWIVCGGLFVCGCATQADHVSDQLVANAVTVAREAAACRQAIAGERRYQELDRLMPLAAPYRASVVQMSNTERVRPEEVDTLIAWTEDTRACRQQVVTYTTRNEPVFLPLVLSNWAEEDDVFVGLIQRKLSWGAAVTRRVAIFDALTNLTP
jgi:hypothetical protein